MEKIMSKKATKIVVIIAIVLLSLSALAGIATGIYFGVATVECVGYVRESGTNNALSNVSVTDGKNVVKTDENGYYKLKGWHKAEFVTVSIPSGYWTEDYYIAIENKFDEYNFSLDKSATDNTEHTFLQVSDTEIGADGVGDWINDIKNVVAEQKPAFIMHTGDICYTDGLKSHINGMNSENMGVPVRYSMGNHDYVEGKYGEKLFETIYGPTCYSFDVGEIHYIVTPMGYGDKPARYSPSDIWRWVANDIANIKEGQKVVMFNHTYCPDEEGFTVKYGGKKLNLRENGLIAWLFGHWHYNYVNNVDGILNISTSKPDGGGIDHSPNAVRSVQIKGSAIVKTDLHYAYTVSKDADTNYKWRTAISGRSLYSEPIVVGDRAYIGTMSDNYPSTSAVTCVNLTDGSIVWEYETINSIRNSIAYKDGKIVAQDSEGNVYCLNADNGSELWQTDCKLGDPRNTGKGVVIDGDNVYCGNPTKTTCINLADGSIKWQSDMRGNSSSPNRDVIHGDYLIVGSHWDKIVVYNKNTGKKLWDHSFENKFATVTPVCVDDKMYFAHDSYIAIMQLSTGKVLIEKKMDGYNFDTASRPIIDGNIGYYNTVNKGIVAINLTTYEIVWNFETRKSMIYTSPYSKGDIATVEGGMIEKDGKFYFGASDGYVYVIDKATGNKINEFNIGSPIFNSLAFYGNKILVADFSGNATLLDLN